jgi:NhaP-type Na+/H+ or K+/H+ antiporter
VRFGLTGEAGLNDGTAFPFVMLGLGLLGLHDIGPNGWRWVAVDLVWAGLAGLACGWALGTAVGKLVLYLRRHHREALGLDEFLTLGLIALSYGVALQIRAYGFLAVFAAGVALRRIEMRSTGDRPPADVRLAAEAATDPEKAPAYMTAAVLGFNEQIERFGEVAVVLILGSMFSAAAFGPGAVWFVPVLLLVVRPVAVWAFLVGSRTTGLQRRLIGWFGIRGVGSVYYLMFAVTHGLETPLARQLAGLTLATIAVSVVVHGVSVTPLMNLYERVRRRKPREGINEDGPRS